MALPPFHKARGTSSGEVVREEPGRVTDPGGCRYCNACTRRAGQSVPCALCPNLGGALKQSTNPRQWAHLSCVVWTPEAVIGDTVRQLLTSGRQG
jgi:hypothetical protein